MKRHRPYRAESTFSRRVMLLVSLLSLLLATTPIEALSAFDPASSEDTCCEDACATDEPADRPTADDQDTAENGCCPSDCHGCFLKCCVGFLSLRPARPMIRPNDAERPAAPEARRAPASSARGAIDHPPRS